MKILATTTVTALVLVLLGCGGEGSQGAPTAAGSPAPTPTATPTPTPTPTPTTTAVARQTIATFDSPWAMVFLPDGRAPVTEKPGSPFLVTEAGAKTQVAGAPTIAYSGQLGMQDVALDPAFAINSLIWLSFADPSVAASGWPSLVPRSISADRQASAAWPSSGGQAR